jgi:acyl dehydratase
VPLNRAAVGKAYRAEETFEVSREHIRRFADAIGDANPAYRDAAAARALGHPDVIAPPTYLTTVTLSLSGPNPIYDPEVGVDYARVVHGEMRFVHHRPARPGDVLTAVTTITDIRAVGANEVMTMTIDLSTTAGEAVCTAHNVVVSRGTAAG